MIKTTVIQKQIELTTVETTEKDIRRNIAEAFKDILNDYDLESQDDREMFQADFNRLTDIMEQMDKKNFAQVFKEAYTPMALSCRDFEEVDAWFVNNRDTDNEIEIRIKADNGFTVYVIDQKDIKF